VSVLAELYEQKFVYLGVSRNSLAPYFLCKGDGKKEVMPMLN